MAYGFPPQPVYPQALDTDYTLFLVNNTTESVLVEDNEPWSDEIAITPVPAGSAEVWANNGFCTLEGELIYYDAVEKDSNGKVSVLKRCARNLGGKTTKFNSSGTWIRGFVIAEHHNQLVSCILKTEDFIGIDFDDRVETLDYRIRNLRETPSIFDDFSCPDVTFDFQTIENDPASGLLARYSIAIDGSFNSYRLDFGDGAFTTTDQEGTHRYALNSQIDPVVTVTNSKCQIIQTPITRSNPTEPQAVVEPPIFDVPIPEIIDLPPIIIPPITQPDVEINIPPTLFPCIDITPFPGISINIGPMDIQVPSVVSFTPIDIPSVISFTPVDIPDMISVALIEFGPTPSFSPIGFGPSPVISPIVFGPVPSISPIDIDVTVTVDATSIPSCIQFCDSPSSIAIDWGAPPTVNVAFVQGISTQSVKKRKKSKEEMELELELGDEFREFFTTDEDPSFQVEYSSMGIPHEITIVPPDFQDIKLVHDLPTKIDLQLVNFPEKIELVHNLPTKIELVGMNIPSIVTVVSDIPSIITVVSTLPNTIELVGMEKIPSSIYLDASGIPDSIKMVGAPQTIELKGPESIKLVLDENVEVPLVYKGPPIEMKIEMPKEWLGEDGDDGEYPCFRLIPCK